MRRILSAQRGWCRATGGPTMSDFLAITFDEADEAEAALQLDPQRSSARARSSSRTPPSCARTPTAKVTIHNEMASGTEAGHRGRRRARRAAVRGLPGRRHRRRRARRRPRRTCDGARRRRGVRQGGRRTTCRPAARRSSSRSGRRPRHPRRCAARVPRPRPPDLAARRGGARRSTELDLIDEQHPRGDARSFRCDPRAAATIALP